MDCSARGAALRGVAVKAFDEVVVGVIRGGFFVDIDDKALQSEVNSFL
jgi:hypothetical protein